MWASRRFLGLSAKGVDALAGRRASGSTRGPTRARDTILQALATPSRLHILATLIDGPRAAGVLAERAGLEASACSHQLRILRHLGLIVGERDGRSMIYTLADQHLPTCSSRPSVTPSTSTTPDLS